MLMIGPFKQEQWFTVSCGHVVLNISGHQGGVKRPYNAISSKKSGGTGSKGGNGGSNQRNKKPKVMMFIF